MYNHINQNNSQINKTLVDLCVILGAFFTLYISYVNTLNYKANIKSICNSNKSNDVQEKILEIQRQIKEELIRDDNKSDNTDVNIIL